MATGALATVEEYFELLQKSDSTESYDRTEKFDCYKTIASFREYVLVSSKKKRIEVHKKLNEAEWLSRVYTDKDETAKIDVCEILLVHIYYAVAFEPIA